MTASYIEAKDAMFALFNTAWQAGAGAIVGSVPEIRWQGVEGRDLPPTDDYWCRVSLQTLRRKQATLGLPTGDADIKRYTVFGLIFVQVFCPMALSDAGAKGELLAQLAQNAFSGKTTDNGVWFRNTVINELPATDDYYIFNVVAEYTYDDIGE